jgi:hypothetical protein
MRNNIASKAFGICHGFTYNFAHDHITTSLMFDISSTAFLNEVHYNSQPKILLFTAFYILHCGLGATLNKRHRTCLLGAYSLLRQAGRH